MKQIFRLPFEQASQENHCVVRDLAAVVERVENTIHYMNKYQLDNSVLICNCLSNGQ